MSTYENSYFGFKNEYKIISALNGKKVYEVSQSWRQNLYFMFNNIKPNDVIICEKCISYCKEDVAIIINGVRKTLSVKIGTHITIHTEKFERFCNFLTRIGLPEKYIDFLKLYHYGDGTLDGTGTEHLGMPQLKEKYKKEIEEFNQEVYKFKYIKKVIYRLIKGTENQSRDLDFVYYGNAYEGRVITVDELVDYCWRIRPEYFSTPHFGPFTYSPAYRGLTNFDPNNESRLDSQFKWHSIIVDFNRIEAKRGIYHD